MSSVVGVTGANGGLGSLTIKALIDNKFAGKIVAISRDPTKTEKIIAENPSVILRKADFNDFKTLVEAFTGIDRLLIVSTDAVGIRVSQHENAFKAAKEAGVKHIAYTSLTSAHSPHPFFLFQDHHQSEEILKNLGVSYSILRNNFYSDLFAGSHKGAVTYGHPVISLGQGKIAYVTKGDCGRAAASILSSSNTENNTYNITGPEPLSGEDVAKIYSEILKKDVKNAVVTSDQFKAILIQAHVPEEFAGITVRIQELAQENLFEVVTNDVEKLTGRKPESYKSLATIVLA